MTPITPNLLTRCGASPVGAALYAAPLAAACQKHGVITPARLTPFLANVLNESAAMTRVEQDMTYTSAAWLAKVYPSKFASVAAAQPFVGNPGELAARVYGTDGDTD